MNLREKFWKFIDEHMILIFTILITLFSLVIRITLIDFKTTDYVSFLLPWYNELYDLGGLSALKYNIGDYNAPYLTLVALLTYLPFPPLYSIKALSIFFDYMLALSCMMFVHKLFKEHKNRGLYAFITYVIVVMLPTVILNSSAWAQCDSIYTTFLVLSFMYLIDEKYFKSFMLLGISFAFKLQFIFLLPVYILVYINKRNFSILHFMLIPLANFALCIPAMLAGRSIPDCMSIYINQTKTYSHYISMNFAGIYNLFLKGQNLISTPNESLAKCGTLFTIFIFIFSAFIIFLVKRKLTKKEIVSLGLWCVLTSVFFLPHMHDRYMFSADILSIIYLMLNKEKWYIPLAINFVSTYCYFAYLFENVSIPISYVSILLFVVICILTKDIIKSLFPKSNN